jgi:hypothetical protein
MKHGVTSMTTGRVPMGAWLAVSLHWRNAAEDETGMIDICVTSFVAKMHAVGLKTGARSTSALNGSNMKKGTMTTMVPIMINLTDSVLPKEGLM